MSRYRISRAYKAGYLAGRRVAKAQPDFRQAIAALNELGKLSYQTSNALYDGRFDKRKVVNVAKHIMSRLITHSNIKLARKTYPRINQELSHVHTWMGKVMSKPVDAISKSDQDYFMSAFGALGKAAYWLEGYMNS